MDSNKKSNESEMGSGESDDEFYNVKLPFTPEIASEKASKKIEVKKVYSPPRTKIQYDYKFDSSSDEESETKSNQNDTEPRELIEENLEKQSKMKEESCKENKNLSQNTFKVVEKINEELKCLKNSGNKSQAEKIENLTGQNHVATSVSGAPNVPRPSLNMVSPVMVVPPPMVVPQASVMGPMIVPSAIGMGGPMAMMPSQNIMGNMIRGPNTIGLASNAIPNSMIGMNAVPGMMAMQGNIMGMPGGMINSAAAMGGMNMGIAGNILRMSGASNGMFRVQGPSSNLLGLQGANSMMGISRPNSNIVGIPRPVNIPPPPSNLMVNNPLITNPGGLMVMGGVMGSRGGILNNTVPSGQTGNLVGNSNTVRMVNSPQGNLPVRVPPPPPPFMNLRGRPPVPPGNFRWHVSPKIQGSVQTVGSPTASSPNASSTSSSPHDKSNREYDGDEFLRDDKDNSPSVDTDESQSPPREIPNTFKNDGSFMEMFKKMTKESENSQDASSSNDKSGNSETSDSSSSLKKPAVMLSGIVGKRRGGRVLKTGLVKKVKKDGETEEEKHPKDAWSMYMAEVKKYREASCEEEGKTRPLRLEKMVIKAEDIKTYRSVPVDPRFPNTNQTKHCYQNYLDFHRCVKKRGEDFDACQYFRKAYKVLCPNLWIEKWDEQVAQGTFAGKI